MTCCGGSRRASLAQLQMRIRIRHAARKLSVTQAADAALSDSPTMGKAPKVPHLILPTANNTAAQFHRVSTKAAARAGIEQLAAVLQSEAAEQPAAFQIPAWRESSDVAGPEGDMKPCSTCGRTFNAQALLIHERVCAKVSNL